MCEKRIRKVKKGSHVNRLREARRLQRLQRLSSSSSSSSSSSNSTSDDSITLPCPHPTITKSALQNRALLELAWRTVALVHRNRVIQQKIVELQKETSDFVAMVMSHPENKRRYLEHVQQYGNLVSHTQIQSLSENGPPLKKEVN